MSDNSATTGSTRSSINDLHEQIQSQPIRPGTLVSGRLGEADGDWLSVTIDSGSGRVPADEVTSLDPESEHQFFVETIEDDVFNLSYHKAERLALWHWLEAQQENGEAVKATIISETRGGLAVDVRGVKGLLARLELSPGSPKDFSELRGQTIDVRVMRLREKKAQVVVSQRALTEGDRAERKAATLASLDVGQVLEGEVRRLANFGAFVDIGGIDGLLHVKDMRWKRVDHPGDVVQVGDVIQVKVLRFDIETEKIALGMKQLLPDPWTIAAELYVPGHVVAGNVVGLTDFGAFIMLDDGIEGLVHVSEISWSEKVTRPGNVLKKGQAVNAWVIRCDIERRRLGLTLRNPAENPWLQIREKYPIGEKLKTTVTKTVEFGLFVDLGDGLEGLVHVSDFSWGPVNAAPSELYEAGADIEVMILDIDEERGRANLGIKQLSEDLAAELIRNYEVDQTLEVTVTSIQSYGVFAELEAGLEGMIHVSALGTDVSDPNDVVSPGQKVTVTISAIDIEDRRISLTLVASESAEDDAPAEDTVEAAAEDDASDDAGAEDEASVEDAVETAAEEETSDDAGTEDEASADDAVEAGTDDDAPAEDAVEAAADDEASDEIEASDDAAAEEDAPAEDAVEAAAGDDAPAEDAVEAAAEESTSDEDEAEEDATAEDDAPAEDAVEAAAEGEASDAAVAEDDTPAEDSVETVAEDEASAEDTVEAAAEDEAPVEDVAEVTDTPKEQSGSQD